MGRLTAAHVSEFTRIRELCHAGLDSTALRERVGERLGRHLKLASFCFGATDPATALPVHSVSVGLPPEAMRAFLTLVLQTPSLDFGPWVEQGRRVARLEELVADPTADPYVRQVLVPSGHVHEVQLSCAAGGWSWGHLCLRRTADTGPFKGHEVRFLDALVPHLTTGLRAAAARAVQEAAPGSEVGVVILGEDGRVELANGVAERLFSRPVSGTRHSFLTGVNIVALRLEPLLNDEFRNGLRSGEPRPAEPASDPAPIARPVPGPTSRGTASDPCLPTLLVLEESSRATYRLRGERVVGTDGRARGLVTIEPATFPAPSDQLTLLAQFGLTRRECDVAVALMRGRTSVEIAERLVVSVHTVADHVRAIYEKVGVSSRQALALRLLGAAA